VLSLGRYPIWTRFSVRGGRETRVGPGGPKKSLVTVSITGFNTDSETCFKDRFKKRFQELFSKKRFSIACFHSANHRLGIWVSADHADSVY